MLDKHNGEAVTELSSVQQEVWFDHQLRAGYPVYNIGMAWRIAGKVDATVLQKALSRVAAENDSLRIVVDERDGHSGQRFLDSPSIPFEVIDFAPDEAGDQAARTYLQTAFRRPFEFADGLLWEAQLIRVGETHCYWLLRCHHLIVDGIGVALTIHAVANAYNTLLADPQVPVEPAPSYRDFIEEDRSYFGSARHQRDRLFWGERFAQLPAPLFSPRAANAAARAEIIRWEIERAQFDEMHAFAEAQGFTFPHLLMAALSAYCARRQPDEEIVIGFPTHNRSSAQLKRTIGMFSSVSPIGIKVDPAASFVELMRNCAGELRRCYRYQRIPVSEINRVVNLPQGRPNLFDIVLSFMNASGVNHFGGAPTHVEHIDNGSALVPLGLYVRDHHPGETVLIDFKYDTGYLYAAEVQAIRNGVERLISAAMRQPEKPLCELDVSDESELQQVLFDFNATAADYPQHSLIHAQFEARAAQTPEAVAAVFGDTALSYAELNARANRLAHQLISLGVRPDDRVALCLERNLDLLVALLGILKAGGCYVPLDPNYPTQRIAYMLDDCKPVVLLTQASLQDELPASSLMHTLLLDDDEFGDLSALARQPDHNPQVAGLSSRNLAYIIYTSGSTGQPKGVMVEHRNVLRLVLNNPYARIGADDCVAHCANIAFDASTWEIWSALLNGGRVLLVPQDVVLQPEAFSRTLVEGGVTAMWLTVGLFNEYVDLLAEAFGRLRYLLVGGDALDPRSIARLLARAPAPQQVVNGYGPTETTTFAITHAITAPVDEARAIPIGRPIANTTVYILDPQGQPVPVGVAGEIHIGGHGVARGYLNRAELTAERFLPDPFSTEPDARMYRTGDLGRWLPDGSVDYLGRIDQQVKIRGFRIELGEIEGRLATCHGVGDAVVVAREDEPGEKRLVAYLTAKDGASLQAADLRSELLRSLPDFMVPGAFVTLERLPLTPNGKLDRNALPAPDLSALASCEFEAPAGAVETTLAELWQDLLKIPRVGRHDRFFTLGGHSLLAVQLISRLRDALGIELLLRDLLTDPSLAQLARLAGQSASSTQVRIGKADRSQALPLSFAQQRLWFIDRLESAGGAAYHMPAALRLTGTLDRTALRAALDRLVARHENLRTTFPEHEGEPRQHIAPADCGFALAERDLTHLHGSEQALLVSALCTEEAGETFDLAAGPLIRGQLLQLGETEYLLLITKHHIISDGWSIGVMVRELSALYAAFAAGLPDPLPPLAIQYADYALWQRQWLQGEVLGKQTAFWKAYLAGAPELLELPTDRPRPMLRSYAGAAHAFTFPAELSAGIRALGQRHGTTLFMTLLAGWSLLLARLSGQRDVVVGTPVANRQRSEIESLIGFFVNSLALRVQLDETLDVAGLLAAVRANTLAAFEHQDLPFEQVVEAISPVRSMSYSPLFQMALSLEQGTTIGELQLPGLAIHQETQTRYAAHFDLNLVVEDDPHCLRAKLCYATDLFDETSMRRLADGLLSLLTGMVANDGALVDSLPLMDAAARSQVLVDFNATTASYPQHSLIHTQFEARAAQTPEAIAAVFGDTALSYAELNARANRLAHALLAHGVDPDDRVVLCAERGVEMLVGILAVLKAGGCYVPLDPSYPDERIAFMLADAAPKAVLTLVSLRHRLPVQEEPLLLDDAPAFAAQPDHNPQVVGLSSRNLAYIIYTSGSTGQPKGVMVEHRNVLRLVLNNPYARIGADDCVAHCANIAFDASTWEIWSALLNGGRVLLVPQDVVLQPEAFSRTLVEGGVTAMWLTVGLFNEYVDLLAEAFGRLRYLLVGGDALDPRSIARLLARAPAPQQVVNGYGPTETTTFAITHAITAPVDEARAIPIGRPIANTTVYILDPQGQPVPVGVAGEIHIGGHGVARGYLNRAELTAERFLTDPFSAEPDARMYRTGDLGRWLPDGSVDYLGRNDFQVKIRGFRIELGEIESRLAGLDGLRDVAVLAREDQPGEKRLVAYYTLLDPLDADALDAEALRTHLARQLPDYMVPAAYCRLDAFPLTPNGKLNRRELPPPNVDASGNQGYTAPEGELECGIAEAWQALLGVERIGRNDHFFKLGGHSLMAVRLLGMLRERFHVEMPLRELFEHPVLWRFAERVKAMQFKGLMEVDMDTMRETLADLSESELLALLAQEAINDE